MSRYQMTLFNNTGSPLLTLSNKVAIEDCSYRHNNYGRLNFNVPWGDKSLNEFNYRDGNLILVEFDNGLPDWVGAITQPRSWQGGVVKFSVYSGEYLLKFRRTGRGRYFTQQTVGEIARALITEANTLSPYIIKPGDIWVGGTVHSPDYHFGNLYTIFTNSLFKRLTNAAFFIRPNFSGGLLTLNLHVAERRGFVKPNVALVEGINVGRASRLETQGDIWNWVDIFGQGDGWSETARPYGFAESRESQAEYGLRQYAESSNAIYETTVQATAETRLEQFRQPSDLWDLYTINKSPGLFGDYDLGDTINLTMPSYGFGGFDGVAQVTDRQYKVRTNECNVILQ